MGRTRSSVFAVILLTACGGATKDTETTTATEPAPEAIEEPAVAPVALESLIGVWESAEGQSPSARLVFCDGGGALLSLDGKATLPAGRFDLKSDEAMAELFWMNDEGDEKGPISVSLTLEGTSLSVTAESGATPELEGKTFALTKSDEPADCNE